MYITGYVTYYVEMQCFESVDEENTAYIPIENDISVIVKLLYSELKKSSRQLKSVFHFFIHHRYWVT